MTLFEGHIDPASLEPDICAYRSGDAAAGDRLSARLRKAVKLGAARLLGDDDVDIDDVVQDSLLACLGYLRDERGFKGDPTRLAVTIARNRCRDLLRHRKRRPHVPIEPLATWLADSSRSPLDDIAVKEQHNLLQDALNRLSKSCRDLLRALYYEEQTPEEIRHNIGLTTVHGVYYRRGVCLENLKISLQRHLRVGSGDTSSPDDFIEQGMEDSGS